MISHIVSKCSKLGQKKHKTKRDLVGKVNKPGIVQETEILPYKWYIHNPVSVLVNETHKVHSDFEIQTDHLFLARQPDKVIINK